ncbi:MAG TPA: DMT family transporter [Accumulibacter sp.]|nr:DMT family transporter [Accumulibacter sp.]HQC81317.1 DMT family transporter [Accumulibacter sp.]
MQALWMVLASFLFACMGVCVKLAAATHSAIEIVAYRSILSLTLMLALVRWRGVSLRTPHWRWQISRGAVGFLALFTFFWAITHLPLATAVTLNYTSAIFLAIFLALAGMRLTTGIVGSLLLGLTGVGLLLKPTLQADQLLNGLVGLVSGVLAGLAYFSVRELGLRGEPESRTVFYFSLVSSAGASIWLIFSEIHPLDRHSAMYLFGVAAFATGAQLAMTRAYAGGKALLAAALAYSTVVFASLFGMLLWNEAHDTWTWLAIGLIVLSGVAATHFSQPRPANRDVLIAPTTEVQISGNRRARRV